MKNIHEDFRETYNYLENNFKAQKIPYAINEHYALDVSG